MKTFYNVNLSINYLSEENYGKLIDFLEENNITYIEKDFEEYVVDNRSESEKYEDWLADQADMINEDKKLGIL